jgi:hypothetical protein
MPNRSFLCAPRRSLVVGLLAVVTATCGVSSANAASPVLAGIACPSAGECVAVGEGGRELTFDPATRHTIASATLAAGHDLASVACPSSTECTAVDGFSGSVYAGGDETTFNPLAPGSPGLVTIASAPRPGTRLLDVACPSVSECVADQEGGPPGGQALSFNPASPGTPASTHIGLRALQSMSCASVAECTFVDFYDRDEVTICMAPAARSTFCGSVTGCFG